MDICSSWISEFNEDENDIILYKKLPNKHNDIINFAKKETP